LRVVTTCHKAGLEEFGHRWLDGRKNWPKKTEFYFYTEGYDLDASGVTVKDIMAVPGFAEWKAKHIHYRPPGWQWDVVKFAHKVFAAWDALYDYDGVGVWLDADVVTHKKIPAGVIEKAVDGVYVAHYGRTGYYTETGMWVVDCSHPNHRPFMDALRTAYLSERYQSLSQWHDCMVFDAALRGFVRDGLVKARNLSGEFHKDLHPMAKTEYARYLDHCKGNRKTIGRSSENKHREAA
jgi:hypothetical protein